MLWCMETRFQSVCYGVWRLDDQSVCYGVWRLDDQSVCYGVWRLDVSQYVMVYGD